MTESSDTPALALGELPLADRPRERLRHRGPQALSVPELLTILLAGGTGGRSALAVAHDVLARSEGSLRRLAAMPIPALTAIPGVGTARAVTIHAAFELGRRVAAEAHSERASVRSPREVYLMFAPRLEDLPVEEFHVATLDTQHRLERDILVTRGLLDTSIVHPREVYREAIAERAAGIILIHNHPSGDPTPSPEDKVVTEQLVLAGRLLGIPVFDHVIIGRGRYTSFAEAGLL